MSEGACDNCGFPDPELLVVRRVYLEPAAWDTPGRETVVSEPERWCVSCVSQYPCEIKSDDGDR